jgi:TatD DNase family protein
MPLFIDTHAHLFLPEFDADRAKVVERAIQNGVRKILLPNIDQTSILPMNNMANAFPGICHAMMGLHPTSVKENYEIELGLVEAELKKGTYVGIGEIGIDLYWDKSHLKQQSLAFAKQLEWSLLLNLPVVIHARESFPEILEIVSGFKGLKGIFHAFTGDLEIAEQVTRMGFKIGIGGILTFKTSLLPQVIREIPLESMVLETDSPYLAPVPFRGKRNESSYIPLIAEAVQRLKNVSLEEVAHITTQNVLELFTLPDYADSK